MAGDGREGDWECGGCGNRNYAFRFFCNRCKQPRLLVDSKTPSDSKWLPRVGDWICSGCTNNNYASREKCKKCGQPKEVAAMPAFSVPGVFSRSQGSLQHSFNMGILGNNPFHHPYCGHSSWLGIGTNRFGHEPSSAWSFGRNDGNFNLFANANDQTPGAAKGWRNGDWICGCGFHNYSSRAECKKCGTPQPALGIKRLASDDLAHDYDNKRLNVGPETSPYMQSFAGSGEMAGYSTGNMMASNIQLRAPALIGKGAKHWRVGDWVCIQCNNHNYASRMQCNRCQSKRPAIGQHGDDDYEVA